MLLSELKLSLRVYCHNGMFFLFSLSLSLSLPTQSLSLFEICLFHERCGAARSISLIHVVGVCVCMFGGGGIQ